MTITTLPVSFSLIQMDNVVSFKFLWNRFRVQADLKSSVNLEMSFCLLSIYSLPGMVLDSGALLVDRALTALLTSSTVRKSARLAVITTYGRWAMASLLLEEGCS